MQKCNLKFVKCCAYLKKSYIELKLWNIESKCKLLFFPLFGKYILIKRNVSPMIFLQFQSMNYKPIPNMKLFTKMVSSLKGYNSVLSKLGNDGKLAH